MTVPRTLPLLLAALLLAACAAGGPRSRSVPAAPGGHARVDPALIEALDAAPPCCATLAELPYQPLAAQGPFTLALTPQSPAFEFDSGKSFFAAYSLAGLPVPFTLEIASLIPDADHPRGPQPLIAPSVLILDTGHRVIARLDSEAAQPICRPGDRSVAYSLRWRSDAAGREAAYLVVMTTEQMRRTRLSVICGVAHHGLSPVGVIAAAAYDDRHGLREPPAVSVRAQRHGVAAGEPGILLIGSTGIHYFEKAPAGFRPALDIPFERIDSATPSAGAAWQRAGRRLSVGYRAAASTKSVTVEFAPVNTGAGPATFADQLAEEIEARLPATKTARR